ncbi:MAG: arylsulfatase [Fulvivirga sp.]
MNKIMVNNILKVGFCLCAVFAFGCSPNTKSVSENLGKPNIIYILADDLGYGDLGCYGQEKIETPNIDKLAAGGIKFTNHYSGSTVCAPSRSSLMTGLHTGHTPVRGNKEHKPEGQQALPDSVTAIAQVMKTAGYATGAFGKWGLGFIGTTGDPNHQGFDQFFGYNCQRQAHRYYPEYLWHNSKKVFLPGNDWKNKETYAQDVIQEKTLAFIEANKDKPFFAFVPMVIPHAELAAPEDSLLQKYRNKFTEEKPYKGGKGSAYGPDLKISRYQPQPEPRATFAAMVQRMDVYVGQIVEKLEKAGIADNTIIMFASDNGPHKEGGADPNFFQSNGELRGHKRDLYEGGIRTPFIVNWPSKVKAGQTSAHISAFWDILPTLAEIAGAEQVPENDGISFLPTILGEKDQAKHDNLYWEFVEQGGKQAVRKGDWKAVKVNVKENPDAPIELYNLAKDLSEQNDVASQHPDIVKEMNAIMDKSHESNQLFPLFSSESNDHKKVVSVD